MSLFRRSSLSHRPASARGSRLRIESLEERRLLDAAPIGVPLGDPFLVSDNTSLNAQSRVSRDADGDFVVVWIKSPGTENKVYARLYDADGTPKGNEFLVNVEGGQAVAVDVAMDGQGNFVVIWSGSQIPNVSDGIYARLFDSTGEPLENQGGVMSDAEFLVEPHPVNINARVAVDSDIFNATSPDPDGADFVVVWSTEEGYIDDGFFWVEGYVHARLYDDSGEAVIGSNLSDPINFDAVYGQQLLAQNPVVAMVKYDDGLGNQRDGDFVVSWQQAEEPSFGSSPTDVYARAFYADGTAKDDQFRVHDESNDFQQLPEIAMNEAGNFVVAWINGSDIPVVRLFDANGMATTNQIIVEPPVPAVPPFNLIQVLSVDMDRIGNFVVAWVSTSGGFYMVWAKPFNAGGQQAGTDGEDLRVTVDPESDYLDERLPDVAMDEDGNYVVTWTMEDLDPMITWTDINVYAQRFTLSFPPEVVGRHIFYNQSKYDGNNAAINTSDDSAIATEKVAYLPGDGLAGANHATSYTHGINGIMVDIANLSGTITADDFTFKVSNTGLSANNTPSTWATAPSPTGFSVRAGAGDGGSDRVEIVWANAAIANKWLEVIVEGNDAVGGYNTNTELAASDIFFFANKIGDDFDPTTGTVFITNSTDQVDTRDHFAIFGVTKDNIYDFDRNGVINSTDQIAARDNFGLLTRINIGSPPSSPEAAPASAGNGGGSAIASALAAQTTDPNSSSAAPWVLTNRLELSAKERPPERTPASVLEWVAVQPRQRTVETESLAADLAMDDELLDGLLVDRLTA